MSNIFVISFMKLLLSWTQNCQYSEATPLSNDVPVLSYGGIGSTVRIQADSAHQIQAEINDAWTIVYHFILTSFGRNASKTRMHSVGCVPYLVVSDGGLPNPPPGCRPPPPMQTPRPGRRPLDAEPPSGCRPLLCMQTPSPVDRRNDTCLWKY